MGLWPAWETFPVTGQSPSPMPDIFFNVGAGHPRSDPHAGTANTLLTERLNRTKDLGV